MRHVGIRPKYKTYRYTRKLQARNGQSYELLPEGGYRLWTDRMLNSGCNQVLVNVKRYRGLIYCPHCEEWFSEEQFVDE